MHMYMYIVYMYMKVQKVYLSQPNPSLGETIPVPDQAYIPAKGRAA